MIEFLILQLLLVQNHILLHGLRYDQSTSYPFELAFSWNFPTRKFIFRDNHLEPKAYFFDNTNTYKPNSQFILDLQTLNPSLSQSAEINKERWSHTKEVHKEQKNQQKEKVLYEQRLRTKSKAQGKEKIEKCKCNKWRKEWSQKKQSCKPKWLMLLSHIFPIVPNTFNPEPRYNPEKTLWSQSNKHFVDNGLIN